MDNDGIKRGDRADTGDLEARPTAGISRYGSGVQGGGADTGHPTADPRAMVDAPVGEGFLSDTPEAGEGTDEDTGDIGDLAVLDATDPSLGLTNIGDVPADDWAADTGPTRSGEAEDHGVDRDLTDQDVSENGRRIDFEDARHR